MGIMVTGPSSFDMAEKILDILWLHDDILFEEDHPKVKAETEKLASVYPQAEELLDILNRADENGCLDQEDLFEAQDMAEDMIMIFAKEENRREEMIEHFPWLFRKLER